MFWFSIGLMSIIFLGFLLIEGSEGDEFFVVLGIFGLYVF